MRTPPSLPALLHSPAVRLYGGVSLGVLAVAGACWWWIVSRRPSAAEIERRRRERLHAIGRIASGVLVDARTLSGEESTADPPEVLIYSYELRGVTYECGQDVSELGERVRGWRPDQPVSVRYDPANPGNSVIVTESWGGR